ncbi:tetratricopeptide repeat protein [Ornithinibacillus gellani]|uniref:tetratricopeptide repeat protein n=1 Tax=Ornithinibacillus gellani TaxID=2293253 RepID=UPI000F460B98|nr:tetratricopeptide repeat protein [Ornithinibacillus gellani]TQS76126.1 tetratricopeptide repeat protein [Ornithinibacillus gellani]
MEHDKENENLIIFPKWRHALEEKSLAALKEKKYDEALAQLDELLSYQIVNHEIIIGKLICLMELGRYDEAQDLCEDVIHEKDENYYHYVHIYLTILFQTNQYRLLMEQVELELEKEKLPPMIQEQFMQLYNLSEKMEQQLDTEKTSIYLDKFREAISHEDFRQQWLQMENIRKIHAAPVHEIISLLNDEKIHPVVQTSIFEWLQEIDYPEQVKVRKLGLSWKDLPIEQYEMHDHPTYKRILLAIRDQEQKNPTQYELLKQLLHQYTYVRFPIMPPTKDTSDIAEALRLIVEQGFTSKEINHVSNPLVKQYIDEINMCAHLYNSVIED